MFIYNVPDRFIHPVKNAKYLYYIFLKIKKFYIDVVMKIVFVIFF